MPRTFLVYRYASIKKMAFKARITRTFANPPVFFLNKATVESKQLISFEQHNLTHAVARFYFATFSYV